MTQPEVFRTYLGDSDSAVRYWSAIGLLRQGRSGVEKANGELRNLLADTAPNVRIIAAEALARYGETTDLKPSIEALLKDADATKGDNFIAIAALNSLTEIGADKIRPYRDLIAALPKGQPKTSERIQTYIPRLLEYLLEITAAKL